MDFEKVVVVGSSRLWGYCALECNKQYPTEAIENGHAGENRAVRKALAGIFQKKLDRKDTMDYLDRISERTLVFSVCNTYLFPQSLVRKFNMTIINFHPALLPKYPGRNSEAWAIYEGEEETGITWHYVDENVDNGHMIVQKRLPIEERDTAISLYIKLLKAGEESFSEALSLVRENAAVESPLNTDPKDIKLSKDIPNGGFFDLNWDIDMAGRFLRAMDFGLFPQFPNPFIVIDDILYTWRKYAINDVPNSICGVKILENNAVISYKRGTIILKKLTMRHRINKEVYSVYR